MKNKENVKNASPCCHLKISMGFNDGKVEIVSFEVSKASKLTYYMYIL